MSKRTYPRYVFDNAQLSKGHQCQTCKIVIPKGERATIETVQYNEFRGDDDVFYHHTGHNIKQMRKGEGANVAH